MTKNKQTYNRVSPEFIHDLTLATSAEQVYLNDLEGWSKDYTEDLQFIPEVAVAPQSTAEVQAIVKICRQYHVPLTARGAGTGLSGGALPTHGGLVLLTHRLNQILAIDTENFQVRVQPGVINQALQNELAHHRLFYGPDPASRGSCFIGGNLAHNAGGPRAVKYGVTRDQVLNLTVVTGSGEMIQTGANTLKNSTGYALTSLMVGSEGTLGIITEATLKVYALPQFRTLLLAEFENATFACSAVADLFKAGLQPSALEFMESEGLRLSAHYLNIHFPFKDHINAYLLIEFDGENMDHLHSFAERTFEVLEKHQVGEVLLAESSEEQEKFWKLRRAIGEMVKAHSIYKEEDTVVPRAQLPQLLSGVKEIGERYGFQSICYGHAGDGNLHVNILKGDLSQSFWEYELKNAIREIFMLCKTLGGTISGEHGIGLVQKEYMSIMFNNYHLKLMESIKACFDPDGILNPGKIWALETSITDNE